MEPSATPFDIAPIPPSPFAPSLLAWAILLGIVVVIMIVALLATGVQKRRQRAPEKDVIRKLKDITQRITQENAREVASEAVRALALYEKYRRPELSGNPSLTQNQAFRKLDTLRFAPLVQESVVRDLIKKIEEALAKGGQS